MRGKKERLAATRKGGRRARQEVVPGVYQLRIRLRQPRTIQVGVLGRCRFPPGWYIYTGSARGGLAQRIGRHLRRAKRCRWHIDYLVAVADGVEAFVWPGEAMTECELHRRSSGADVAVRGFGSSDCRCPSHLAYFKRRPTIAFTPWARFRRRRATGARPKM